MGLRQENFNDLKTKLTDLDIEQIVTIVGYRCRIKTCQRLTSILKYGPSTIGSYGILSRLVKESGQWEYIAGQSYTDEIRVVRECILGKQY
jgi:hypothetical protein